MPRVQLANGALRDQVRQDLFDSHVQAVGADLPAEINYFKNIAGKTPDLTNLRTQNQFENQVSFLIQGLGIDAQVYDVADAVVLPLVLEHSSLKLRIGEKIYWDGHLRHIAGKVWQEGGFLNQFGSHDDSKYRLTGSDSVAIPPLQSFEAIQTVTGLAGVVAHRPTVREVRYVFRMMGLMRRPVQ